MLRFKGILLAGVLLAMAVRAPVVRADPTFQYTTQLLSLNPAGSTGGQTYINFAQISTLTGQTAPTTTTTIANLVPNGSVPSLINLANPQVVNVDEKAVLQVSVTAGSAPSQTYLLNVEVKGTYGATSNGTGGLNGVNTLTVTYNSVSGNTWTPLASPPTNLFSFGGPESFLMTLSPNPSAPGSPNANNGSGTTDGAITAAFTMPGTGGTSGGGDTGGTGGTSGGTQQTPEPSTMLLSCLGLSAMGAAAWRKRRKTAGAVTNVTVA